MDKLPKECIQDIDVLPIEDRQDKWMDELFERWCELKRKEFDQLTEQDVRRFCISMAKEYEYMGLKDIIQELD